MTAPTRRERLRTATVSEIKASARQLLVSGGPQAISLRAIARDMGMTAPAIYRYFPSLDALIIALVGDLYDEVRETIEHARDTAGDDEIEQMLAMSRAFRSWSIGHPAEFALVFGNPMPELSALADDCGNPSQPPARFGAVFIQPLLELWERAPFPIPPHGFSEEQLSNCFKPLRQNHDNVPIEVAYLVISGWSRLYGLVAMEVFNQLHWAVTNPETFFEAELSNLFQQLSARS